MTVAAVVLDIEGTTGSADHVREVLFPYARERLASWFDRHRESILAQIRSHTGNSGLTGAQALALLTDWLDRDVKAAPLKSLQGRIWAAGYADGSLTGHVYPDVPVALANWRQAGVLLYIYSSGSVAAQRDWFAHTPHGDLTGLLSGYFDLTTAGDKRSAQSYRAITDAIGAPAEATLFLSDTAAELDAAVAAAWQATGVRRQDDPRGPTIPGHRTVPSLLDLDPT